MTCPWTHSSSVVKLVFKLSFHMNSEPILLTSTLFGINLCSKRAHTISEKVFEIMYFLMELNVCVPLKFIYLKP